MKVTEPGPAGLKLISLDVHGDERGFFVERFNLAKFRELGLPTEFVQDNHSRSAPGVVRGLHFQHTPPQAKLVGAARGRIWDVAVDVRRDSPTFGSHFAVELSDLNGLLLWIPEGFAHGFCVLGETPADVFYKVNVGYRPEGEVGIRWDDPELGIPWPLRDPVLSRRDAELPSFRHWAGKS
jgi:dTDP-4-dehydrorhamnose 3,5-epimerase